MKKYFLFAVLISVIFISQSTYGQFKEWGTKFGMRFSALSPGNEFHNLGFGGQDDFDWSPYKFSYLAEGFFAFEISKAFEIQVGAGYGTYTGEGWIDGAYKGDYESAIIPITARFRVSPWDVKGWNPYISVGGGMVHHTINENTILSELTVKEQDGWIGIIPFSIGSEFALSEVVLLDFSIGGAFFTSYLLDGYESKTDPIWDAYWNVSGGLTFTGESCSSDRDKDGIAKCDEEALGTNPKAADSDGDGLNDGEEVNNYKTNPLAIDTDEDLINDYDEIYSSKTDPLKSDTDNDRLNDGEEVNKYKTDPLKADTDGDSLLDGDEYITHKTDPLKADTDSDGLSDNDELNKYKTNPLVADTDGDGLTDSQEVLTYKTNPLVKDTDGGTIEDNVEVKRGTDPLKAEDDVVKIGVPIVLDGITFATGKAEITPESENTLRNALKTLTTYSDIFVEIGGHTDNVGNDKSNQKLSEKRANAVRDWFIRQGIEPGRITAVGYGEAKPAVPNDTKENKQINRRIEFTRVR